MFVLSKIFLSNHPSLGSCSFELVDDKDKIKSSYKTVIIGNNGVGKSTLLYVIVEFFRQLERVKESNQESFTFECEFSIEYLLNKDQFSIHYLAGKLFIEKNEAIINLSELELPNKLIVSTLSTSERFPVGFTREVLGSPDFDAFYQYFGSRSRRGQFSHGHNLRIAFDTFLSKVGDSKHRGIIHKVFKMLYYDSEVEIEFSQRFGPRPSSELSNSKELEKLIKSLKSESDKNYIRRNHVPQYVIKELHSEELVKKIIKFYNELEELNFRINVDLTQESDSSEMLSRHYKEFVLLQKIGVLSTREITLFRKGKPVGYRLISSGENQILSTFLSLAGTLEKGSLVLFDEPDINLHPEWQSRLLELLDSIFKNVEGVHYLLVTHSPFIISDLKEDSANILRLERRPGEELIVSKITTSYYGQSIEEIVLDVFNLATSRNYALTQKTADLIDLVKRKKGQLDENEKEIVISTKNMVSNLKSDDPLRNLIEKIASKLNV